MDVRELLVKGAGEIGVELEEVMLEKFMLYLTELKLWGRRLNLTGIKDDEEIVEKHFIDSLVAVKAVRAGAKLIDVGTGAGFPGIPLKIVRPTIKLTLLESVRKKTEFLRYLCDRLGLEKVAIIWGRAEEYGQDEGYRERYDLAVCRALGKLVVLCEYCLPFLVVGGELVIYKGKEAEVDKELVGAGRAIEVLGGELVGKEGFWLPFSGAERTLVFVEKVKSTPAKYPRRVGMPKKRPLSGLL